MLFLDVFFHVIQNVLLSLKHFPVLVNDLLESFLIVVDSFLLLLLFFLLLSVDPFLLEVDLLALVFQPLEHLHNGVLLHQWELYFSLS